MTGTWVLFTILAGWWAGAGQPSRSPVAVVPRGAPAEIAAGRCGSQEPGIGRQVFDRRANALLRLAVEPGRQAAVEGRSEDLEFRHETTVDGSIAIRLSKGPDVVEIRVGPETFEFRRGDRVVAVARAGATEAHLLAVERLLAGSPAVRGFRGMTAALEPATWRTPEGAGVQLADLLVGLFQGEVGAAERMVNRIKLTRRPVRQVRQDSGCFEEYEAEVVRAYDDWAYCVMEVWGVWRDACNWRFVLWAESAWFHMIGCSAIPIRGS